MSNGTSLRSSRHHNCGATRQLIIIHQENDSPIISFPFLPKASSLAFILFFCTLKFNPSLFIFNYERKLRKIRLKMPLGLAVSVCKQAQFLWN